MHPHLLNVDGAATLIKTTPSTTRRWACSGDIPATRIGGQWRLYIPALLERVIGADQARHATPPLPHGWQEPGIVTAGDLAELLDLPVKSVRNLLNDQRIPATKVGGQHRAYWPSILACIANGRPLLDDPTNPDAQPLDPKADTDSATATTGVGSLVSLTREDRG